MKADRKDAVGRILVDGRPRGCGFTIGPRVAATAHHVVRGRDGQPVDASLIRLVLPRESLEVARVEVDPALDVAVLHLRDEAGLWLRPGPAELNSRWQVSTQPHPNDPLLDGRVAAVRRLFVNAKGFQLEAHQLLVDTEADDYEGYSGSPVESPAGVVIGVLIEQVRSRLRSSATDARRALPLLYATPIQDVIERFGLETGRVPEELPAVSCRMIGIPVAFGLDLFRDRVRERALISQYLSDPGTRLITIVGRRGIGKSALAAKVLDLLANGVWPHGGDNPLPRGIVCLSTRTSEITIERIFMDCALVLGEGEEDRLHAVWRNQRSLADRVHELFSAMSDARYVILLDNMEDKLGDGGELDDELGVFFDILFRARRAPCVLVTTQIPLALPPELLRFDVRVNLVEGLPTDDAVELLRDLDRSGDIGIRDIRADRLARAAERVHGIPRALELVVGALADDYLTLPTLDDLLATFAQRGDVLGNLVRDQYNRLDDDGRGVMNVLSVFGRPVPARAVAWILPGLDVPATLRQLARAQLVGVDRTTRTFALHPMDADLIYARLPAERQRELDAQVASWYAAEAVPEADWRSLNDVTFQRYEFEHRVKAGDFDAAARVLGSFDEFLIFQGSVAAAVWMHTQLEGRLTDPEAMAMHYLGLGIARIRGGPFSQAVTLLEQAFEVAAEIGDLQRQQRSLLQLGKAHRQQRQAPKAVTTLTLAIAIARENEDWVHEAHALLGLCLTHCYAGDAALARAVADELDELVGRHPDDLLRGRAADARSIVCLVSEDWQGAIDACERALLTYERSGIPEAVGYVRSIEGIAHLGLGLVDEAIQIFLLGRHEGAKVETIEVEGLCLFNLTWAYWRAGRVPEVVATATEAADLLEQWGGMDALAARALAEAAGALAEGDTAATAHHLRRTAEAARGNAELIPPAWFAAEADRLS
ncbi:trypsin-like peptidase domain-containing protein [Nonomuraea sp. NPDC050691]|uniref:trypsin-like peptidase domain-containing protein n=1 Tax=Nonomuraea sp. NPDC050691 TaxID=3155661 RepID=UPI0034076405